MSPYIETIRLQDGELRNLPYHQERFERTRSKELGLKTHPLLHQVIRVPDGMDKGLLKCRVVYEKEIERCEFKIHARLSVRSLQLVYSDSITYPYKLANRSELDALYHLKGACDDILIVKEGCITDSYYANPAFWDGRNWFTSDTPLLPGTMRASLIDAGMLKVTGISPADLGKYQQVRLINAMNDLNEGPKISMDQVKF